MLRRLTAPAIAFVALFLPLSAVASVSPDASYGDGGLATYETDCSTLNWVELKPGYDGEVFLLEECGSGYRRIVKLDDHGQVDPGFGTSGRITFRVDQACQGESRYLVPGKDGSLYALFWGLRAKPGYQSLTDAHICIVRVTSGGQLAPAYGGSSPVRRLTIANDGFNALRGGAVDGSGRLLVFSNKDGGDWPYRAVLINRYTLNGKPDRTFSGDGRRAFTYPFQDGLESFGVLGDRPVVSIRSRYTGSVSGPVGTAFVRFSESGGLDPTFSGDGKVYVKSSELAGGSTYGFTIDEHKRLTYVIRNAQPDHSSTWIDLRRLGPTGVNDSRFERLTGKIQAPAYRRLYWPDLQLSNGHYVLNWQTTQDESRTSGFNGDGSRWTALGTNGTFKPPIIPVFARDRSQFYWFTTAGSSPEVEAIYRRLVQ